jgi:hypothetical protein
MKKKEIEEIIGKAVSRQLRDGHWTWEREDLASEAWVAVLEAFKKDRHLSGAEVFIISTRTIMKYKMRMRDCLSSSGTTTLRRFKESPPKSAFPVQIEAIAERFGEDLDLERKRDLEVAVEAVRRRLTWVEVKIMDALMSGDNVTSVWRDLQRQGFKQAKRLAFEAPKKIAMELRAELGLA